MSKSSLELGNTNIIGECDGSIVIEDEVGENVHYLSDAAEQEDLVLFLIDNLKKRVLSPSFIVAVKEAIA